MLACPHLQVAIAITPHTVREGGRGLVVVGGSLELGDAAAAAAGDAAIRSGGLEAGGVGGAGGEVRLMEAALEEQLRLEAEAAAAAHGGAGITGRGQLPPEQIARQRGIPVGSVQGEPAQADDQGVDTSRHFSMYAFEGGSGDAVWQHASGAFRSGDLEDSAQELRPQDDYRCVRLCGVPHCPARCCCARPPLPSPLHSTSLSPPTRTHPHARPLHQPTYPPLRLLLLQLLLDL